MLTQKERAVEKQTEEIRNIVTLTDKSTGRKQSCLINGKQLEQLLEKELVDSSLTNELDFFLKNPKIHFDCFIENGYLFGWDTIVGINKNGKKFTTKERLAFALHCRTANEFECTENVLRAWWD